MMHIDLTDDFEKVLADAIYGGPAPPIVEIRRHLCEHGLERKFHVIAVRVVSDHGDWMMCLPTKTPRHWALRLHPGLVYVCFSGPTKVVEQVLSKTGLLASSARLCPGPSQWIPTIQQAIITLRDRELKGLAPESGRARSRTASLADEQLSRRLALQAVQRDAPDWPQLVHLWVRIVLLRNAQHLNTVRRRLVEFITELTRDIDTNVGLAYPFTSAMDRVYRTFAFSAIPEMIVETIRDLKPHLIRPSASPPESSAVRLTNLAIDRLNDHIDKAVRLDELAHELHVSPNHLARTFKRVTGKTVIAYLHALRVGQAKHRLRETDLTVLAVALECGFESAEHFHRIFRRLVGLTPGQYRAVKENNAYASHVAVSASHSRTGPARRGRNGERDISPTLP